MMNSLQEKLKQHLRIRWMLLLVLALGFFVRLPGLGRDLWLDEALSLFRARGADVVSKIIPNGPEFTSEMFAQGGGRRHLLLGIQGEYHPPIYPLLLRGWITLFGDSDPALRLLSVTLGIATLVVIFFLGRKIFDERIGLAAASVLAVLPLHIQYSQEARPYPLAVLLAALASWAYWTAHRVVGRGDEWRYWLLYVGLAAAGLYTHYFTAWVLLAHGVHALFQPGSLRRALMKRLLPVVFAILILFTPWLLNPSSMQLVERDPLIRGFWSRETLARLPALMFYFFSGYLPGTVFKSLFGLILLGTYALGAVLVISIARDRERQPALLFTLLLVVVPVLSVVGLAAILDKAGLLTHPRYILSALTGFSLLLGAAIRLSLHRKLSFLMAATIVALSLYFQMRWYELNRNPSTPWYLYGNVSSAVTWMSERAQPNELLLFDDGVIPLIWNVYQKVPLPQLLMDTRNFSLNQPRDFESKWQEVEKKYAGIYLVRLAESPPREVLQRLEARYRLINSERIGKLEIRHYVRPSPMRSN